ncbi:MAG: type 1 glutamine amidotransferase [Acidimicrobiia bacterium]
MRVLVVTHGREMANGWLDDALAEVGAEYEIVDPSRGDDLPVSDYDKVIVLGGHMGAYDQELHPWLTTEKAFIKRRIADETPLLGVCLGAQLIAEVGGGRAYRADHTEAGMVTIQPTRAGRTDPVLSAIEGPVVAWHHDTFELPSGAELLGVTDDYPHAFRYGRAFGVQFHPEVTPDMFRTWASMAGPEELKTAGLDPDHFAEGLDADADRLRRQAVAFFRTWLEE